jgi:hypothetical protein
MHAMILTNIKESGVVHEPGILTQCQQQRSTAQQRSQQYRLRTSVDLRALQVDRPCSAWIVGDWQLDDSSIDLGCLGNHIGPRRAVASLGRHCDCGKCD